MDKVFGDFRSKPLLEWIFFVVACILILAVCFSPRFTPFGQSMMVWGAYALLVAFMGPTILRGAAKGHKHVFSVCFWSTMLLVGFIVAFYFWYFNTVPALDTPAQWWEFGKEQRPSVDKFDRILNIVPVITAIAAASLGWYVHYQFSSKAHRTNNAFSMVMEMRKSSEFLKRNELVLKHFPTGTTEIPEDYRPYFPGNSLRKLHEDAKWDKSKIDSLKLERAEAIQSLKYVLNYYEFIAAGVKAGDLDEELLIDTVSEIVIRLYRRSEKLIKFVNQTSGNGQGQLLAYSCLAEMVKGWEDEVANKESALRKKSQRT